MDGIKITTIGLDDTTTSFTKLGGKMTGRQMIPAVLSGTLLILRRAKELVPRLTSTLFRSLHVGGYSHLSPGFDTSEGYSDIEGKVETQNEAKLEMGTNLIYGPIQEFGGIIRAKGRAYVTATGRGWVRSYLVFKTADGEWHSVESVQIPAQPYIRPAFDEKQDACVQEISDALDVMIAEALK